MTKDGKEQRVLLGTIGAAHGIRGELIVKSFTADPESIACYGPLTSKDGRTEFKLRFVRASDKGTVVRIDGINDRTAAERLRGQDLYILRSRLPETDDGEFYYTDLIGLSARSPDGAELGKVVSVANFGAGDLLEIRKPGTTATDYIPFTNASVPEVNLAAGYVVVDPPEMTGEQEPSAGDEEG